MWAYGRLYEESMLSISNKDKHVIASDNVVIGRREGMSRIESALNVRGLEIWEGLLKW